VLRIVPWLAWGLCAICITLAGLVVVFSIANHRLFLSLKGPLGNVVLTSAFPLVGALVATRQPHNPLGWIFCTIGLSQGLVGFANEYAVYALWTAPGSLSAGSFMAWLTSWIWGPGTGLLLTYLLLLFPDGRLPSPRWRPVAWLSGVPIALVCGPMAILNWPLRGPALIKPGEFTTPIPVCWQWLAG
jgi:two-component system NarL family sensor kinase